MRFFLIQLHKMVNKGRIVSLAFFATFLYVYCMVNFVKASGLTTEKGITEEAYSKVTSSRKRGSIQEQPNTRDVDICADIIGRKGQKLTKQEISPCPKLVVWVPKKPGFTEFVKVNEYSEVEGGFCIALFCHALELLPFSVQPDFQAFVNDKGESKGTYDQLLKHIEGTTCQAVAGDVTIRGNRLKYVDFTMPYLSSEVYMLVRATHEWNQTIWTFLRPFTRRLWITIVGASIFVGVAIAILEYRAGNPKFVSPFYRKLIMVIWFPISTFFFHEGKILNRCSKVVLVMWLSMIFIVVQIFTASLSSWLTLDQLHPKLRSSYENVGYQDGSFLKEFIKKNHNWSGNNSLPLGSAEEYKKALSNGIVNAVYDELPYVDIFLAKYGSDYMKFGPLNQEAGIAFAFPRGSHLLPNFSRAVINVTESETMMKLKEKYLGLPTPDKSQHSQALPQSLDVQSFIGLFIFMGSVTIVAIIYSEISLMLRKSEIVPLTSTDK